MNKRSKFEPAHEVSDRVLHELQHAFAGDPEPQAASRPGSRPRIVIEADDLPDAVTLDGDLSPGSGRSRVVIDAEDDIDVVPVAEEGPPPPTPDPRLRARRIAVRRAESRRRIKWVVGAAVVIVLVAAALVLLASPLLSIRTVEVEGAVYTDPERLAAIVGQLKGEPILTADLDGAERRLEEIPWVRAARVTMHFPDRVSIQIAERSPIAHFRGADGLYRVIDVEGRVLDAIEGIPADYLPIDGSGPNVPPGEFAGTSWRAAAQLANALPVSLRPRVERLGVTEAGELTMELSDPPTGGTILVRFGFPDRYQDKLVALINELPRHEPGTITVIDVSTGDPTVR